MSYTKTTDFLAKDSLPTGDVNKIVKGADIDYEFEAIQQAFIDVLTDTSLSGTTVVASLSATNVANITLEQGSY